VRRPICRFRRTSHGNDIEFDSLEDERMNKGGGNRNAQNSKGEG